MDRNGLRKPEIATGPIVLLLTLLLGAMPAHGEGEMFVKLIELVVPATAQPEAPAAPSLQDIFAFGELGVPAGHPGSFVLSVADEAGLEAATAHSRTAELNAPPGRSDLR